MFDRGPLGRPVASWSTRRGTSALEVLAYAADHLSYYQDAVATEALMDTARPGPAPGAVVSGPMMC